MFICFYIVVGIVMVKFGILLFFFVICVLLLGLGEFGKEVVIELQWLGVEVIVVDCYVDVLVMQVVYCLYVIDMFDVMVLCVLIVQEQLYLVVLEIEVIYIEILVQLEQEQGLWVILIVCVVCLIMDCEGICCLVVEILGLLILLYCFVDIEVEYCVVVVVIGLLCVVKLVMLFFGKGQSILCSEVDIVLVWDYVQIGGCVGVGCCIVEGFIDFDYEIILLIVCYVGGILFCVLIGYLQKDGDYCESWQLQLMLSVVLVCVEEILCVIIDDFGGWGLFGVELFVKGDEVWFSEVLLCLYDIGLVILVLQELSEFVLYVCVIFGLLILVICQSGLLVLCVLLVYGEGVLYFNNVVVVLQVLDIVVCLFGKLSVYGYCCVGVILVCVEIVEEVCVIVCDVVEVIGVELCL